MSDVRVLTWMYVYDLIHWNTDRTRVCVLYTSRLWWTSLVRMVVTNILINQIFPLCIQNKMAMMNSG